jgi:hypothetical protein
MEILHQIPAVRLLVLGVAAAVAVGMEAQEEMDCMAVAAAVRLTKITNLLAVTAAMDA